jgi:uncharacterized MnhB-related membrane protein
LRGLAAEILFSCFFSGSYHPNFRRLSMLQILIVAGMLVCALQAIREPRLLISAIWLAGASALLALFMFMLGAAEVAVIELSVGAGLVTVLFVFAINIAGEPIEPRLTSIPRPLAGFLILAAAVLIGWLTIPALTANPAVVLSKPFMQVAWQDRPLDLILQVVLIFAGSMGVLGMLSESVPHKDTLATLESETESEA